MMTSYSALDTFRTCPRKYKYQHVDKIKTAKSAEAVFGTLVHSTMKYIHSGSFLLPAQKDALQHFSVNWNPNVFNDEVEERMAFAMGIKIIQDYYAKNDPNQIQIVDLESNFFIDLEDEGEKHVIKGIIDRIDKTEDGFEVIDYKTARKLPAQNSVDENVQLFIYLLAFLKRYPNFEDNLEKIKLSLYFLKHGVKLSTHKTKDQINAGKEGVISIIREIKSSDFAPVTSPLCQWCEYQKYCPMWKHKFKEEKTSGSEQEETIAKYIELQDKIKENKRMIAELQDKIIEIMKQEGVERLFGNGRIIGKSCRKTYRYDEEKIRNALSPVGLWESVLKVDSIRLKKALGTLSLDLKQLVEEAKQIDKESWSITIKKEKGEE